MTNENSQKGYRQGFIEGALIGLLIGGFSFGIITHDSDCKRMESFRRETSREVKKEISFLNYQSYQVKVIGLNYFMENLSEQGINSLNKVNKFVSDYNFQKENYISH